MRLPRPLPELSLLLAMAFIALLLLSCVSPPACPVPERSSEPQEVPTWFPDSQRADPAPCQANLSVADHPDFAALPAHIRDFLLYRHCRDFPLLREPRATKCAPPVFLLLAIKSWAREAGFLSMRKRPTQGRVRPARRRPGGACHSARPPLHPQVLFLEWQRSRCPDASFVLNGDDDVFAHTDNMVTYLKGHDPDHHLFVGHLIQNVGPIRVPWSKYFVPTLVSADEHYPPYCGGGGFLLSRFTAAALHHAARVLPVFPIDDVFLGMCLRQQGLAPGSHNGVRAAGVHVPSPRLSSFDPCFYQKLLLVHRFLPYETLLMWDALSQPLLACGKKAGVY
ncbi:N-acetyllactosaminide beta-1,3-N-acetylglucosaminyltransferase 3 isoform X1 [Cricetulus griseus]|uniref:N-acetyllactosaminide beta-1,3-N-acetylglucosaminyltransferase 3 isoform X1 n=1 Tax=Cricetulus griseus TaxID=10029 RepID=UPI0015C33188|nr:N-acetyllactosaminide beta-1,3-N-acetylglucosaminyltransferase 3 isoform X1 [Cricetulus griseus]